MRPPDETVSVPRETLRDLALLLDNAQARGEFGRELCERMRQKLKGLMMGPPSPPPAPEQVSSPDGLDCDPDGLYRNAMTALIRKLGPDAEGRAIEPLRAIIARVPPRRHGAGLATVTTADLVELIGDDVAALYRMLATVHGVSERDMRLLLDTSDQVIDAYRKTAQLFRDRVAAADLVQAASDAMRKLHRLRGEAEKAMRPWPHRRATRSR